MHFATLLSLLILPAVIASKSELQSLIEFKKGIIEDPLSKVHGTWDLSSMSDQNACPNSWHGVSCNDDGNVDVIALDGLGLGGELKFFTLNGLKMLRKLSLSGNSFSGRLVPALGLITSLQYLDLSDNKFYGPIPAKVNNLWNLNYLNLSANELEGGFPNELHNLQQLRSLDLHSNRLWGDIRVIFSELMNVEMVDLSRNLFYGSLPTDPGNISSLINTVRVMNLSHNKLIGGFFDVDSATTFRSLEILDLGDNQILGELPSLGFLPNLRILRLGSNSLYGAVPYELLDGSMLVEELDLSANGFTGSIELINATTLTVLNISSNGLSGSLPSSVGSCIAVDLSRNSISGDISIIQKWGSSLEFLDLSSNKLSGIFSELNFPKLSELRVRNNSLAGSLPTTIGSYLRLSVVDLSSNEMTGTLPPSLFTSPTLKNLNLSFNHFTGSIPIGALRSSELLVLPSDPPMESLDLSGNSLSGTLSSHIGNIGRLALLNLAKNHLSGKIPTELGKLEGLNYLDLSNNVFTGEIPGNLPDSLVEFNISNNHLSGSVPENLRKFPMSCFRPGNILLSIPRGEGSLHNVPHRAHNQGRNRSSGRGMRVAIILASIGASTVIMLVLLAYHRTRRAVKIGKYAHGSLFKCHDHVEQPSSSLSFSNDRLLELHSRSLVGNPEVVKEGRVTKSLIGSPLSSSPRYAEALEQPIVLDVYSPDRFAGELFFLDSLLAFSAEQLSCAPAEVLGRSSHGTLYKATLENGLALAVKWLRVGLVKNRKDFSKELKRIGSFRHPNMVPLRAYYWGPREQERLILSDYIEGENLAMHLYEATPRRYSPLTLKERLNVAIGITRCLVYLHDRGLPHGNLKPSNVLLSGPDHNVFVTDYALHRLMMPLGIAEQVLNLGALGYRAPELASMPKPVPSLKMDVYAVGVILMELLTRRSAGDIISGQSGAVDLTDWVRLCYEDGRGMDCIDRDIAAGGDEQTEAMNEVLALSLQCVLPVNERPNIRQVFEEISSICN